MARNNRRRATSSAHPLRHMKRTIHQTNLGTVIKPSPDPPNYIQSPWWPITLTATFTADTEFTMKALSALLLAALGLKPEFKIEHRIRVLSVRLWGLTRQTIVLDIHRLNSIGSSIKTIVDRGSAIQYSRVGWKFGVDSQLSVNSDDPDVIFKFKMAGGNALAYIQILFQSANLLEPKLTATANSPGIPCPCDDSQDITLDSLAI